MGDKKTHMSLQEAFKIRSLLKPVLTTYDDGTCEYTNSHSDQSIITDHFADSALNSGHVARVRKEFFGNLRKPQPVALPELQARIEALEKRLTKLENLLPANSN